MAQSNYAAFMKQIEEIIRRNHQHGHLMTATQAMLQQQAAINALTALPSSYFHPPQLGAQAHGRHWPSPQALHGSPAGVAPSRAGRATPHSQLPAGTFYYSDPPESAPPAIEEAGIRAGEIVAWRVWRLEPRSKVVPKTPLRPLPYVSRDRLAPAKHETEIVSDTPLLRSTYKRTIWEPGQTMEAHADPTTQRHDAQTTGTAEFIGIFAWKTLGALCNYVQTQFSRLILSDPWGRIQMGPPNSQLLVTGQVILWGSVIEHERGYRAQFAKPHRLFMVGDAEGGSLNEPLRVELCRLYSLPEEGV